MHKKLCFVVVLWTSLLPMSQGHADCQSYWTEAYKRLQGCGGGGGGGYVAPAPYIPPPPSPAQIAAAQARPINENGIRAEKAGNYALAVSLFEQAVRLSPGDAVLVNNLRHARSVVTNNEGLQAARAGNWTLALALFEQALQTMPTDSSYEKARATLRKSIQPSRNHKEEQAGREKQLQQDSIAAANMQKTVQGLAQSVSAAPSSAAPDPAGAKAGNDATASGGLSFMAVPTPSGNSAAAGNAAPSGVQLNPGAKLEAMTDAKSAGAIPAGSAREQLFNSGKETTGQLFDGGRAHDDATINARWPDVATPSAQPVDARFANDKDYQAATTDLTNAQAAADTLNKKMTGLQDQQQRSPTPERQIEISNLSAQANQAKGAVVIAAGNLDAVKKKIVKDGPAIIVDDTAPAAATPTEKSAAASDKP